MAEDILRLRAGFEEGINYRKQHTMEEGNRPDFTFLLPEESLPQYGCQIPAGEIY